MCYTKNTSCIIIQCIVLVVASSKRKEVQKKHKYQDEESLLIC
jgi:hypothetical protein